MLDTGLILLSRAYGISVVCIHNHFLHKRAMLAHGLLVLIRLMRIVSYQRELFRATRAFLLLLFPSSLLRRTGRTARQRMHRTADHKS